MKVFSTFLISVFLAASSGQAADSDPHHNFLAEIYHRDDPAPEVPRDSQYSVVLDTMYVPPNDDSAFGRMLLDLGRHFDRLPREGSKLSPDRRSIVYFIPDKPVVDLPQGFNSIVSPTREVASKEDGGISLSSNGTLYWRGGLMFRLNRKSSIGIIGVGHGAKILAMKEPWPS